MEVVEFIGHWFQVLKNDKGDFVMRVCIYCRVSTNEQELNQQIEACKRFCVFKGFDYDVYAEIGSGKNFLRAKFIEMLKRLRQLEYSAVVVFRFDRLGRNAREVVTLFEELENKGIQFYSLNENIDTTSPVGRAIRDIIVRLAQLERENIGEATKQRLQALKNLGKKLGRKKGLKDSKKRHRRWWKNPYNPKNSKWYLGERSKLQTEV
jgi:DNA invertase Pin-like site-specific DNA recombinase